MKHKAKRAASLALGLGLALQLGTAASAQGVPTGGYENGTAALNLTQIARYSAGQYNVDGGVMEIVAYNQATEWAYAINGQSGKLAAIPLAGLTAGAHVEELTGTEIDVKALVEAEDSTFQYGDMTSVAISPDSTTLAAALQAQGSNDAGRVALFTCEEDGSLTLEALVETGAQPDMVTFAGDGVVLTADEGEPREGYGENIADPKGSVTVVDVEAQESTVVDFSAFDSQRDQLAEDGIVLKKGSAPSVDLEPEYIAVSGGKAYVTLQENNAIAVLDIESQAFEGVYSAGFEDHSTTAIDLDKKDDAYDPQTYESLLGIRMPDGIAAFTVEGTTYLVTANEGDAREWGDEDQGTFYLSEDERDFGEEGVTSPTGAITAENSGLEGKVVFFKTEDFDGLDPEKDYVFGGRSFTVFQATENGLEEVFTSGDDFEALTAQYVPEYFNASNDNAVLDDRSGKKGPEAESVTVGTVDGKTYAFVALERTGGVMAYDVTDPEAITFVNYVNTRDFGTTVEGSEEYEDGELDKWVTGGDVAPEGLLFLDAASSPNGEPLLLAACEVSGTVAVYQLGSEDLTVLPFTDVDSDDWFLAAVQYVYENDRMAGTSSTTFQPEVNLTRAMAAQVLYNLEGQPAVTGDTTFTDAAAAGDWAVKAITWAEQTGVVAGIGDGLFDPTANVTREEFAQMMYNYASYKEYDLTLEGDLSQFEDASAISSWAETAMSWANGSGLINGHDDGTIDPQGTTTRAQAASILMNFDQNVAEN
ncbi:MAG: choice-of-anchor I family protein [Acutalibacter sp.]